MPKRLIIRRRRKPSLLEGFFTGWLALSDSGFALNTKFGQVRDLEYNVRGRLTQSLHTPLWLPLRNRNKIATNMDGLLQIIYRLGIVAIWVVALFWVVFSGIGFFQGLNGQYDKSALIFIVGAPILAVVAHLLWRWVLAQKQDGKRSNVDHLI